MRLTEERVNTSMEKIFNLSKVIYITGTTFVLLLTN